MRTLVINDIHLGAVRNTGTTKESSKALRQYIRDRFNDLVNTAQDKDALIIAGDLFDSPAAPYEDFLCAFSTISRVIQRKKVTVHLQCGNHDVNTDTSKVSTLQALATALIETHGSDYVRFYCNGLEKVLGTHSVYVISHLASQDVFDQHLNAASELVDVKFLILHANCNNPFARNKDHSLNVDEAVLVKLANKGVTTIFAHEHAPRNLLNDKVIIIGNQIVSSYLDLTPNHTKRYAAITDGGITLHSVPFEQELSRISWQDLGELSHTASKFVRVVGEACDTNSFDALTAIAKFRQKSDAFIVSNGVTFSGRTLESATEKGLEGVAVFNVEKEVTEQLTKKEMEIYLSVIKNAKEKANVEQN